METEIKELKQRVEELKQEVETLKKNCHHEWERIYTGCGIQMAECIHCEKTISKTDLTGWQ